MRIKFSSGNYRLKKTKGNMLYYPTGDVYPHNDGDKNSVLYLNGKGLLDRKTCYDFEIMYIFGFYFRFLGGGYYNSRTELGKAEFSNLIGNINNLFDLESAQYIGIDACALGRTCGHLDLVRKHNLLTKGQRAEILVYVFVAEISLATFLKKCGMHILCDNFLNDKHYMFLYMEDILPDDYAFVSCSDEVPNPFDLTDQSIIEKQTQPRVFLDNYIKNIAEAEVFLFFFRSLACVIGGSGYHVFFFHGKDWFETCFKSKGFVFINDYFFRSGQETAGRKACFDLCVRAYNAVFKRFEYFKTDVSDNGVGLGGKVSMRFKLIFGLLFLQLGGVSTQSRFWHKIYVYLIPESWKRKAYYIKWVDDFVLKYAKL